MRKVAHSQSDKLHAFAIAGTRAILIALNMRDEGRKGLLGFAYRWSVGDGEFQWLKGMKVFPSLAPQSGGGKNKIQHFPTNENPIQSFLWSYCRWRN